MTARVRTFPLDPTTSRQLEVGDLIPTRSASGEWRCLQITELERSGPGSLKSLMVGVLPWVGPKPPTRADVAGLRVVKHGLTRIEIFTEGGLRVVDHAPLVPHDLHSRHDHGRHMTTSVWGWRTATQVAEKWWPLDPMFAYLPDLEHARKPSGPDYNPHDLIGFVFTTDTYPKWSQERWVDLALRWLEGGLPVNPITSQLRAYAQQRNHPRPLRQRIAALLDVNLSSLDEST